MKLYAEFKSNSGQTIEWIQSNEQAAERALIEVSGTGVSSQSEIEDSIPINFGSDFDMLDRLNENFRKSTQKQLSISFESGTISSNDSSSELVTVEYKNGFNEIRESNEVVNLEVDGFVKEIQLENGIGTINIHTSKSVGEYVSVQAVSIEGIDELEVSSSKKKGIQVV